MENGNAGTGMGGNSEPIPTHLNLEGHNMSTFYLRRHMMMMMMMIMMIMMMMMMIKLNSSQFRQ